MTAESLNEQQGMLVDELIRQHEVEIRHEKGLSYVNGTFTAFVVIALLLIAAHGFGIVKLIGACK